jgi:hypothetical protein
MHITKNECESLLGTLLNMPDRIKAGPKGRHDLEFMRIGNDLHLGRSNDDDDDHHEEDTKGRRKGKRAKRNDYHCPASCFTLSPQEIEQFFNCLLGVTVPYGYSGKISRYLEKAKQKFSEMKSHDYHVLMTQILPVAIRRIMEEHVRQMLFGLSNFLTSSLGSQLA